MLAVSWVANRVAGLSADVLTHEDVLRVTAGAAAELARLLAALMTRM